MTTIPKTGKVFPSINAYVGIYLRLNTYTLTVVKCPLRRIFLSFGPCGLLHVVAPQLQTCNTYIPYIIFCTKFAHSLQKRDSNSYISSFIIMSTLVLVYAIIITLLTDDGQLRTKEKGGSGFYPNPSDPDCVKNVYKKVWQMQTCTRF